MSCVSLNINLWFKWLEKLNTHACEFVIVDPECANSLATACDLAVFVLLALHLLEVYVKHKDLGLTFDQKSMPSLVHFISAHDFNEQSYVFSHGKLKNADSWIQFYYDKVENR